MPSKRKYKPSGLVGMELLFDADSGYVYKAFTMVRVVMEVISPNGRCTIHEDETGHYIRHSEAVGEFVKFGRRK